MKVVFDTNVFVSALTLPDGRGDQALRKIASVSHIQTTEYAMRYEKQVSACGACPPLSPCSATDARRIFLSNLGEIVEPAESLTVLADEPDNRIVECALAANAQLIVTGDRAMLALGEYQGIRIISLSAYLG